MATTVTKVIDPNSGSGYDYDSLYDWEGAQQGDLTGGRDEIAVAKCRCTGGTADGGVEINGWTTSATQYIKIWTDTSESYRHNGTYQTGNKYRCVVAQANSAPNYQISVVEKDVWIDGIQIISTKSNIVGEYYPLQVSSSGVSYDVKISNCVFKGSTVTENTYYDAIEFYPDAGTGSVAKIWNCLMDEFKTGSADVTSCGIGVGNTNWTIYAYNLTIVDTTCGLYTYEGSIYAKNVLCDGQDTGYSFFDDLGSIVCTSCTANDTRPTVYDGSGNRNSQTFTFVGATDFHLASNDAGALGYGTNLYNDANYSFQTDIDGQDRGGSGATWDIGADQYIIEDSVCWGHDTGVTQDNIRNFSGKWYGTGEVLSTGDGEHIELASSEYMISEPIIVPADSTVTLRKNSYFMRS